MKKPNYEYMTWKQFDSACRKIVKWGEDKNFTGVFGIPRGGLILAIKLSHLLEIPLVLSRDDITPTVLVAEDIKDSGRTLLNDVYRNCSVVTLYWNKELCKQNGIEKPHFWVYEKKEKYVVFPWEI